MGKKIKLIFLIIILIVIATIIINNFNNQIKLPKVSNKVPKKIEANLVTINPSVENSNNETAGNLTNKIKIYIMMPDGSIKSVSKLYTSGNIQESIINDLLDIYKQPSYGNVVTIPNGVKINSIKIYDETLIIDFNLDIKSIKFKNIINESSFIKSVIKSEKSSSNKFNDVQFLVEGSKEPHIFGGVSTINPLRFDK